MPAFAFSDHIRLLDAFGAARSAIVDRIERTMLNVRDKPLARSRDRRAFDERLNAAFFEAPGILRTSRAMPNVLALARRAAGFEPVPVDQFCVELDPLELVPRAYGHWRQRHWPGRSGRVTFAQTVYYVFMLRQLELLCLQLWSDGREDAPGRLSELQRVLDRLNAAGTPAPFVRDVRWLVQTAQGPLTRQLAPYFSLAAHLAASFDDATRLELHRAGVLLAGGHLRSQLRYRTWETKTPIDDIDVLTATRNSNAMDGALLVRDLIPLLEAYEAARTTGDESRYLALADTALQGLSADPELLVTRLDLLGPCTAIEDVFIDIDENARPRLSPDGRRHAESLERYTALIGRLAPPLRQDAERLRPDADVYSPFGIVYGFCADIFSSMATTTLVGQPARHLTIEDLFVSRHRRAADLLQQAEDWAALPRRPGEREHFYRSLDWAADIFDRLVEALERRTEHPGRPNASRHADARLVVVPESTASRSTDGNPLPVPAPQFCRSSDPDRARAGTAVHTPAPRILSDRAEGRFLASIQVNGHWFAISKDLLTVLTSRGQDALLTDVPAAVVQVLTQTCPNLIVVK